MSFIMPPPSNPRRLTLTDDEFDVIGFALADTALDIRSQLRTTGALTESTRLTNERMDDVCCALLVRMEAMR